MARDRSLTRFWPRPLGYVNISWELNRWMKRIRLPRTVLRRRYAQLVHVYSLTQSSCNHTTVIYAMQSMLQDWVSNDGDNSHSPNALHLRRRVAELRRCIRDAMGDS
jgi:hypothetical protein